MMEETNTFGVVLPLEIYEYIFSFLDGYTLLQVEKVCSQWKGTVEWLGKKTSIWERACHHDIPKKIFLTMVEKSDCGKKEKYEILYRNWISWQHVSNHDFFPVNSKIGASTKNVTCAKISGNHIIYGTLKGALGIHLDTFKFKEFYESNVSAMVNDVYFLNPMEVHVGENYYQHSHLLIVYDFEFKILALSPKLKEITSMFLQKSKISVNGNQICACDAHGYIEIFQINFSSSIKDEIVVPLTSFRLFSPMVAQCIHVFDKVVTVVTESKIFKLDYNKNAPKWKIEPGQMLPFPPGSVNRYWTFYHEVVFATGYTNFCVVTIANNKKQIVSHTFNWMSCLGATICEIYYYGNILFITTHAAQVYIYVIKDWTSFNLMKYDLKLNLKGSPILTVDVQELKDEHRLLLAMNECIFQVFLYQKVTKVTQLK